MTDSPDGWPSRNERRFADFKAQVISESDMAFKSFMAFLPEELLNRSQKPSVMSDAIGLLHAKSLLLIHQPEFVLTFVRTVGEAFTPFESSASNPGHFKQGWREENLSLVSYDDMEEDVALTAASTRIEAINSKPLWALGQRFSMLVGGKLLPENTLPVSPLIYCQGLRKAMHGLDISVQAKLVIYKLFEEIFLAKVGALYQRFNQCLIDEGVLPNLNYAVHNEGSSHYRPQRQVKVDAELMKELISNSKGRGRGMNGGHESTSSPQYNLVQLVEAAQSLQQYSAQKLATEIPTDQICPVDIASAKDQLIVHLQAVIGAEHKPGLTQGDMKSIELVGLLFEYMLNDEQLPDVVKTLLSHFHTPFIKVALANKDFFDHEEHPARLLMNRLADAGVKWVGNDGKSQYGVLEAIRATVTQVVDEFEDDPKLLAKQLIEFSGYIKKVAIKVQMLEKRAAEKARGEDRLNQVKQRVNKEVKARISDIELPSAILLFLLQPWSDYLAFLLLRYGESSEHWQQAINLIDDLIWGLELEDSSENKMLWRQNYPWVESTILKGFDSIGYDPGKATKLKRAIDKVYQFSYKGDRPATPDELKKKLIRLADEKVGRAVNRQELADSEKNVIEELSQLKFGAWFEYRDGHREKLAWYNRDSLQFLFVDQGGRRTGMRDGAFLARQVISGELSIVVTDEQPLVERTLESIYTDLTQRDASHG